MKRVFPARWAVLPVLLALILQALQALAAPPKLDQSGRWLLDPDGRMVMIGGGNLLLPEAKGSEPQPYSPAVPGRGGAKPADGRLSTHSMLGDLLGDERARAILDREVPELARSLPIGMGSQMTLRALQPSVPQRLNETVLDKIDRALAELPLRRP